MKSDVEPELLRGALVPVFGDAADPAMASFASVRYADAPASVRFQNGRLEATIPSPGNEVTESWRLTSDGAQSPLEAGEEGAGLSWIGNDEHLFALAMIPDQPTLAAATHAAYLSLLRLCARKGYERIYRIWNYVGDINGANAEGLERYRDFCLGRAKAFEEAEFFPKVMPAATGIGFRDGGACVFLIARRALKAAHIENPLQVPAYEYPDLYGPKPPSFARATLVSPPGEEILYVSGTASIRDHRTVGADLETQIKVTTENIEALIGSARKRAGALEQGRFDSLKIYVRREGDAAAVADHFRSVFAVAPERSPVFLSDICRSELLMEVEAVFRAGNAR